MHHHYSLPKLTLSQFTHHFRFPLTDHLIDLGVKKGLTGLLLMNPSNLFFLRAFLADSSKFTH